MNHSWMSAIIRRLNSVENKQVFCPWSSLRMSAWTVPRTVCRASAGSMPRSRAWSMTVLRKNASTVGAGPLMVMLTLVVGASRSKPS